MEKKTTINPDDYVAELVTSIEGATLRVVLASDDETLTVASAEVPAEMPCELRPALVEITHATCLRAYRSLYARHDLAYIGRTMQEALSNAQKGIKQ